MKDRIKNIIRYNADTPVARGIAAMANSYLRSFHNADHYDMDHNGERALVRTVLPALAPGRAVIVDVGANTGDWTAFVLRAAPDTLAIAVEIEPSMRERLARRFADRPQVVVPSFGLSDRSGEVEITVRADSHCITSISPRLGHACFADESRLARKTVPVEPGTVLPDRFDLDRIDFLKIDVEGHEAGVLEGFAPILSGPAAPRVVQLEYGTTFLPFRRTLGDVYRILEDGGYAVGRLHPHRVAFKPYDYEDDHFRMGNHVAVKRDDPLFPVLGAGFR